MSSAISLGSWSCQKEFLYCEHTENVEFPMCQNNTQQVEAKAASIKLTATLENTYFLSS